MAEPLPANQELSARPETQTLHEYYSTASNLAKSTFNEINRINTNINKKLKVLQERSGFMWWRKAAISSEKEANYVMGNLNKTKRELADNFKKGIQTAKEDRKFYEMHIERAYEGVRDGLNDVLNNKLDNWTKEARNNPPAAVADNRGTYIRKIDDAGLEDFEKKKPR